MPTEAEFLWPQHFWVLRINCGALCPRVQGGDTAGFLQDAPGALEGQDRVGGGDMRPM